MIRRIWQDGKPTHGGLGWRCRKPLKRRIKTLACVTDGRLLDRAWEVVKRSCAELVTFRKRDRMARREREIAARCVLKESAIVRRIRRDGLRERVRASWKNTGMQIRKHILGWKGRNQR